ncbi:unnamed protein product [Nezara viridula]|uniref:Ig-like domain-containing protein n=1 Tax=Nezara viridula TaxID=85310 RepID=A0A9P0EDA5_NEZVI|nr:unnamed protein product [Nezara viridula]
MFHSVDRRGKSPETGIHWKNDAILEERSYFRIGTEPPTLTIDNVEERDEAIYRCRVDFKTSPTRNYKINLTVIVSKRLLRKNDKRQVGKLGGDDCKWSLDQLEGLSSTTDSTSSHFNEASSLNLQLLGHWVT